MRIRKLGVRVVTSSDYLAGTDNDVSFDIGPLGWKLDISGYNDFGAGDSDTYSLDLHGLALDTDDIVWLRLQKKGLFGKTGAGDGLDGEWRPSEIHLLVNDAEFISRTINVWLADDEGAGRWWWMLLVPNYNYTAPAEMFALTQRMLPSNELSELDKDVAAFTTPVFKDRGISGWVDVGRFLGRELQGVVAIGRLARDPAVSTDDLVTIDLELEQLRADGQRFHFPRPGVNLPRFLRVECLTVHLGTRLASLRTGVRMKFGGWLRWDTDDEGWYEIHPQSGADVTFLPPAPRIIRLNSAFGEHRGNQEDVTYEFPGCNVKDVPAEWAKPRVFHGKKYVLQQTYSFDAEIENRGPFGSPFPDESAVHWDIAGHPLPEGSGVLVLTGGALLSYTRNDLHLELSNLPGQTVGQPLQLTVSVIDEAGTSSRGAIVSLEGERPVEWEKDYYIIVLGCSIARRLLLDRLRLKPQAIPKYDPAELEKFRREDLVKSSGKSARKPACLPPASSKPQPTSAACSC